jgi:membrane-bound lytic murein transglycosylase D
MDYLDVADEIRLTIPPPKVETNQPPQPVPNPPPQKERELWVKKVSGGPWPALAKEYVPELKPIFAAQKTPPELVWVAEVESSFDRRARSPAGAAGLFQLMPATAKRFGLSLWPRDQRFQPEPSATASAQYLKYLHDRFKDWRLALAAYNAGEGTVQKLLDRHKTRSYDVIAEHLPAETQMYVPRVEATLWQREGAKLEQLSAPLSEINSRREALASFEIFPDRILPGRDERLPRVDVLGFVEVAGVAQAFQPAGSGDFPVTRNGTGKFLNQQTGMSALQ